MSVSHLFPTAAPSIAQNEHDNNQRASHGQEALRPFLQVEAPADPNDQTRAGERDLEHAVFRAALALILPLRR